MNKELELFSDFDYKETNDTFLISYVLTNSCNLNCSYCIRYKKDTSKEVLTYINNFFKELDSFVKNNNIKKIHIRISGGEITLFNDEVIYFLSKLIKLKYIAKIDLFSNGINFSKKLIDYINKIKFIKEILVYITLHLEQIRDNENLFNKIIKNIESIKCEKSLMYICSLKNSKYFEKYFNILKDFEYMPNVLNIDDSKKFIEKYNIKLDNFYTLKTFNKNLQTCETLQKCESLNLIEIYDRFKFDFNNWVCCAGYNFIFYNKGTLYTCTSAIANNKPLNEKLDTYKIHKNICKFKKCICEQSVHKFKIC